jgi:WD40 repeat protein
MHVMSSLPHEILAQAFPYLVDDAKSYCSLARANKELYQIGQALGGPYKWPAVLIDRESISDNHHNDDTTTTMSSTTTQQEKIYLHQVQYSPNKRHMAIVLSVYEINEATGANLHGLVRILDIAACNSSSSTGCQPLQDILMERMAFFTAYCGNYFVAVEPRKVRVFQYSEDNNADDDNGHHPNYQCIREWSTVDRIVGMQCYDSDHPKIALQTEQQQQEQQPIDSYSESTLTVWNLVEGTLIRHIPHTCIGKADFCISQDDRVCAFMEDFGRPLTVIYMSKDDDSNNNTNRTYVLNLPGDLHRSWIDCSQFSPDGHKLAVLTSGCILQLDTSVEPPQWMMNDDGWCCARAPSEGGAFSGQVQYSSDSQRLVAHSFTRSNQHAIQIWDVSAFSTTMTLRATKVFSHDFVSGRVSLSLDGTFVVIPQRDASDLIGPGITQILACYVADLEDYNNV